MFFLEMQNAYELVREKMPQVSTHVPTAAVIQPGRHEKSRHDSSRLNGKRYRLNDIDRSGIGNLVEATA